MKQESCIYVFSLFFVMTAEDYTVAKVYIHLWSDFDSRSFLGCFQVFPKENFNAQTAAQQLRDAMKGAGDYHVLISMSLIIYSSIIQLRVHDSLFLMHSEHTFHCRLL